MKKANWEIPISSSVELIATVSEYSPARDAVFYHKDGSGSPAEPSEVVFSISVAIYVSKRWDDGKRTIERILVPLPEEIERRLAEDEDLIETVEILADERYEDEKAEAYKKNKWSIENAI